MLKMLLSIELALLATNINLVAFSILLQSLVGQVFSVLIITIMAAESAVGLCILLACINHTESQPQCDVF